ncbi:MAG: MBL fold metallo-hydrolase [Limisphaerales bacterium]
MAQKLTITASSTALFSTWVFLEELGVAFDAGDGLVAGLLQKSRKVRHVFATHADRNHLTGLLQFNQLNDRPRHPAKALRFVLQHRRRGLRSELVGLSGDEIARRRETEGADAVTEERVDAVLGYSGDTSGLDPADWTGVKVLLHECTFLTPDTARCADTNLERLMSAASKMPLEALVLMHFSSRYERAEIESAIRRGAEIHGLGFPVYAIYPGEVLRDVLNTQPVFG